jgi:hypothetical protein
LLIYLICNDRDIGEPANAQEGAIRIGYYVRYFLLTFLWPIILFIYITDIMRTSCCCRTTEEVIEFQKSKHDPLHDGFDLEKENWNKPLHSKRQHQLMYPEGQQHITPTGRTLESINSNTVYQPISTIPEINKPKPPEEKIPLTESQNNKKNETGIIGSLKKIFSNNVVPSYEKKESDQAFIPTDDGTKEFDPKQYELNEKDIKTLDELTKKQKKREKTNPKGLPRTQTPS